MGHFEFSLCPLNSTMEVETEECFDAHRILLSDGKTEYGPVPGGKLGLFYIDAVLPNDLTCEHCGKYKHKQSFPYFKSLIFN